MDALPGRAAAALARVDVPWQARWDELASLVAELSDLVRGGPGARVVARELAEVLVGAAQGGAQRAAVAGLADRVLDLHAVACASGPAVDGRELARWLLWLQTGFAEPPEVRLAAYAPALGEDGLAFYRAEAVARFERLPVIGFGRTGRYDRERWALLRVVEELAEHTGDVDLQVLVLSRDLSSGWHYLQVATVLRDAGRSAEAVAWVERGLAATGGRGAATRLVDLGVDECLRAGWADRGVGLRRRAFLAHPTWESYTRLRSVASASGGWPSVREEVLGLVAEAGDGDDVLRRVVEGEWAEAPDGRAPEWLRRLRAELALRER
ncbi:hypothetical protein IOD16_16060 [Saccharothrix sp. 6-C]|uniref:hypothetical protein n=1 Tax=Saccharothrix sp. 6-C TaxID=2781735 RepID=UPI001916F01E|nr:hypothetical protein [Saccharothrix sp. 6-C]QQQ79769.1 hypothetical protein IOD16_16060 [Saccharothrix sp. 6-C]